MHVFQWKSGSGLHAFGCRAAATAAARCPATACSKEAETGSCQKTCRNRHGTAAANRGRPTTSAIGYPAATSTRKPVIKEEGASRFPPFARRNVLTVSKDFRPLNTIGGGCRIRTDDPLMMRSRNRMRVVPESPFTTRHTRLLYLPRKVCCLHLNLHDVPDVSRVSPGTCWGLVNMKIQAPNKPGSVQLYMARLSRPQ